MAIRPPSRPAELQATDSAAHRATEAGTARFKRRHEHDFAHDHFRLSAGGLWLSSIGIGTYLGDTTAADDAAYETAIQRAVAAGINVIDTAINYRAQRSEQNVCVAVQRLLSSGAAARDELVVCSKGGYIPLDGTPPATRAEYQAYVQREYIDTAILRPDEISSGGHSFAPRFLRYCLAKSRQNLALRTIDIYYLHNPGQLLSTAAPEEARAILRTAIEVLEGSVARGEIGMYGVATWDELRVPAEMKSHLNLEDLNALAHDVAGESHHCRVIELPINLAMTEAVRAKTQIVGGQPATVLEAATTLGMTVVASAPLMQSQLTRGLPEALRAHFPNAKTDAQRALSFVRTLPSVVTVATGMKTAEHVEENLGSARGSAEGE
jgi:aryl-alcohol dehydrogenase-like predicted oxidoreductase